MPISIFERLIEFHNLHPLVGKRPVFKQWPTMSSTVKDIKHWYTNGYRSFGLITQSIAVLDFDNTDMARTFFAVYRQMIKTLVITKRGIHMYFKNPGHIGNAVNVEAKWDVRGNNGYVVAPGSIVAGHSYGFVDGYDEIDPARLSVFRDDWLPSPYKPNTFDLSGDKCFRARQYLKKIEGAVSGQKGHNKTFRTACILLQRFGLSVNQAWPLFLEWNERCQPPWSLNELKRKLEQAENAHV